LCKAVSVIEVRKKHTSWTGNDRCVFQRVSDLFRGKPVQRRVNREVFDDLEKKHATPGLPLRRPRRAVKSQFAG